VFSFPPPRRLLKSRDFQRVFAVPKKSRVGCITALYRSNAQSCSRLGLILAKKQVTKATQRNRIKRLMRESFRQKQALQDINLDIVMLGYKPLQEYSNSKIRAELEQLWKKLIASFEK